jgi:hypothetical protein
MNVIFQHLAIIAGQAEDFGEKMRTHRRCPTVSAQRVSGNTKAQQVEQ